jgi:hypothetical protein
MAMSSLICFEAVNAWNKLPDALKGEGAQAHELAEAALFKAYREADEKWIPLFKAGADHGDGAKQKRHCSLSLHIP